MGIKFNYGRMAALPPGERALHRQRRFRLIHSQSPPSYHWASQLPPVWWMTMHVTNRRVIVENRCLFVLNWALSLWYPGSNPEDDTEFITGVSVGRAFWGEYLEVRSHDPAGKRDWQRSEDLTIRLYFRNPTEVEAILRQAMAA